MQQLDCNDTLPDLSRFPASIEENGDVLGPGNKEGSGAAFLPALRDQALLRSSLRSLSLNAVAGTKS
jgi:hypothetical protein